MPGGTPTAAAPGPSLGPVPTPSGAQLPGAVLPVRGEVHRIPLAAAPGGALYVSLDSPDGAVIVRLEPSGRPSPGWPVRVPNATSCWFVGAANDGTLRAICDARDIVQPQLCCDTVRAFALGTDGRVLPGWPVEIDVTAAARVVGSELVVVSDLQTTDIWMFGEATHEARVTRIAPNGSLTRGADVPIVYRGGSEDWAIGPDGVAYALTYIAESADQDPPYSTTEIMAVDPGGTVAGWPVPLHGIATALGFAADGSVLATVGGWNEPPVRIVSLHPAGGSVTASSPALAVPGLASGLDCRGPHELLSAAGTNLLAGDVPAFYALDARLAVRPGWPYEPPRALQEKAFPDPDEITLDCGGGVPASPALGPVGTLYVPLAPASDKAGGELVAIGRDGAMVAGWPVKLLRANAGFWEVIVGADRTVYALAAEPESGGASITLLAFAPDSSVLWRVTLVEP